MLISIHMTTFCQGDSGWLEAAIRSVIDQSYKNFEFIIYDDASYDGTAEILSKYENLDTRIRTIRGLQNVNSVSKSLGRCFLEMSPEARAFTWMFDDNVLHPNTLEKLVGALLEKKSDVVYGQTEIKVSETDSWLIGTKDPEQIKRNILDNSSDIPNAGILIRREIIDRSGWYDPNIILRRSCDWDLFRRIWSVTEKVSKIDHVCATEWGELSNTSLRNSFDTSFELMRKYVAYRDEQHFRLDVLNSVFGPADIVPFGDWSDDELLFIYKGFVRYFASVGEIQQAASWARHIIEKIGKDLIVSNLENKFANEPAILNAVLVGLFASKTESSQQYSQLRVTKEKKSIKKRVDSYFRNKIKNSTTDFMKATWRGSLNALATVDSINTEAWRFVRRFL